MGSIVGVLKIAAIRSGLPVEEYLKRQESGQKRCTKCKAWKGVEDFQKDVSRGDGFSSRCRSCKSEDQKKAHLKHRYGITQADLEAAIKSQSARCAVCGAKPKKWHVDHCHVSGKFRGMLCKMCNHLLGNAGDSIKTLRSAIKYLESHE